MEDPNVSAWLEELGLGQYASAFADAEVDFETLHELTIGDLREIGVDAVGPRRRLESAITRLRGERAASGGSAEFIGARRHLTILFCDVVGSTALSQRFDAEQMSVMFRDYYGVVSRVLERSGGHEANRLGDGSFIFFGYPQAREHAALQAVLTAGEILDETHAWCETREAIRSGFGPDSPVEWSCSTTRIRPTSSARLPTSQLGCRRWRSPGKS